MKITFVGHASILVETRGVRILSDPWWRGPCFGAQWWAYPPPRSDAIADGVDYIYVSHGHHDHLHPGTLKTLDRRATCLVSATVGIASTLRELGFPVIELGNDDVQALAPGVRCRIMETHADDTLCVIDDGERVVVNLNDSLHAAPIAVQDAFIGRLRALYPKIDYVFCGYGVASHFPNCYVIPGKDPERTAARRQAHFNRMWSRLVAGLAPRHAFPFAADVAFLEEALLWANEPTHNSQRPEAAFRAAYPEAATRVHDIAPGFVIEGDKVVSNELRQRMSLAALSVQCAEGLQRANAYGPIDPAVFTEVLRLLRDNVERCLPYLREHDGDWRFLVRFRNLERGIELAKTGTRVTVDAIEVPEETKYDIVYTTRLHYLRASLTTEFGHEILFVGSGGIFRYARAEDARRNLHRELAVVLVPHATRPPSRFGDNSRLVWRLKHALKRWTGAAPSELYDLAEWTVWTNEEQRP
jgi:Beta-lactamase superfamily domain